MELSQKAQRDSGFKRSGLVSSKNYSLELISTERIETILKNNQLNYVKFLVEEANKKLNRTKQKINKLTNNIKKMNGIPNN